MMQYEPLTLHRVDEEDGDINYEIWRDDPATPLFTIRQSDAYDAKAVAEQIVTAVNAYSGLKKALEAMVEACGSDGAYSEELLDFAVSKARSSLKKI